MDHPVDRNLYQPEDEQNDYLLTHYVPLYREFMNLQQLIQRADAEIAELQEEMAPLFESLEEAPENSAQRQELAELVKRFNQISGARNGWKEDANDMRGPLRAWQKVLNKHTGELNDTDMPPNEGGE